MSRSKAGIFLIVLALMAQMMIGRAAQPGAGGGFGTVFCAEQQSGERQGDQAGAPIKAAQEHDCSACVLHSKFSALKPALIVIAAPDFVIALGVRPDAREAPRTRSPRRAAHSPRAPPIFS